MTPPPEFVVDFPTLGDLVDAWIEHHCRVPGGFARGEPFKQADWQFWCTANHYRVREDAVWNPAKPLLNQAFVYRRSQVVGPQKTGKGPWSACITAVEAVGPSVFGGWAAAGDVYLCSDNGCGCGWEWAYNAGEPKGIRHPSPLIQLTATSEDQVDNILSPLKAMVRRGPLRELLRIREGFVRILGDSTDPEEDRIDAVTSSASSRLGNPISFAFQDETGIYSDTNKMRKVAETQRRGAAGMGGRVIETTNAWDPSEDSVAQRTFESAATDIFRYYRDPDLLRGSDGHVLSYKNKRHRRKIHAYVYEGSWWVDLDSIEAEAAELLEKDPAQAERFFGNKRTAGTDAWLDDGDKWAARGKLRVVEYGNGLRRADLQVVLGFDGSDTDDWTGLRAETQDGYQFTPVTDAGPTIWNPADYGGQVPRLAVGAAIDWLFTHLDVVRVYCDPPYWETEIDAWAAKYGEKRVIRWSTFRPRQMTDAAERLLTDIVKKDSTFTHDGCATTEAHVRNARRVSKDGSKLYKLAKPGDGRKIDLVPAAILAHEAAGDATAGGLWKKRYRSYAA